MKEQWPVTRWQKARKSWMGDARIKDCGHRCGGALRTVRGHGFAIPVSVPQITAAINRCAESMAGRLVAIGHGGINLQMRQRRRKWPVEADNRYAGLDVVQAFDDGLRQAF